ncbi:MAG TPA: hypothetical protein VF547_02085 [Allosphingosinicella sp.]|jgi:hypothetical protein
MPQHNPPEEEGLRPYGPAILLTLVVGFAFLAGVKLFNLPSGAAPAGPPPLPAPGFATMGGFLAYRGFAFLSLVLSAGLAVAAIGAIRLFVAGRRTRDLLLAVLAAEAGVALVLTFAGGSAMRDIADGILCSGGRAFQAWEFCALGPGIGGVQAGLDRWVEAACIVAAGAIVFAIFTVAAARRPRTLPKWIASQERCVTLLLAAGSALLTVRMLLHDSYLRWAFAEFLAVEKPPPPLAAYLGGTATFNGAVETAILGLTWLVALLLMERRPPMAAAVRGDPGGAKFSAYNLPAILTPFLTAVGTGLLRG